jgi:hypothetical protein
VRGWLCYGRGVALRTIVMSLLTDRLLALVGLVGVSFVVWYWRIDTVARSVGWQIAILAAIVVTGAAFVLWLMPALTQSLAKRWPPLRRLHELVAIFRFAAFSRAGAAALLLSCIVMALAVNAVVLFAYGFGVALAPSVAYLVVPMAILLSSLPISIGGWGVREASLSYGFILFGLKADDAALLGLTLGIGLLLASLPGGVVMLMLGGQARPALHRAGSGLID